MTASANKDRFPALDGLRGIAIVGVLFGHLAPHSTPEGSPWLAPLVWVSLFGWTGVDLFFVLSGFLITGILFRNRYASNYFSAFYTHRSLRIFPLYYLLLIIFTFVPLVYGVATKTNLSGEGTVWPYWLFLSNFWILSGYLDTAYIGVLAPTWSLAIEEQFYIAWSIAVKWIGTARHLALAVAAVLLCCIGLRIYLLSGASGRDETELSNIFYFTLTHLDGLCVGILARLSYDNLKQRHLIERFSRYWWIWAVTTACILLADSHFGWPNVYNCYQPIMLSVGFTVLALMYSAILLHGVVIDGWVRAAFESSPLKRLGAYSYCIYLFHMPIVVQLRSVIGAKIGNVGVLPLLVLEFAAVVAFAHLSYVWIETPILSLKTFAEYKPRRTWRRSDELLGSDGGSVRRPAKGHSERAGPTDAGAARQSVGGLRD
jgi:peptidoglycan/LPS O-acetylase OafA/YrhL